MKPSMKIFCVRRCIGPAGLANHDLFKHFCEYNHFSEYVLLLPSKNNRNCLGEYNKFVHPVIGVFVENNCLLLI